MSDILIDQTRLTHLGQLTIDMAIKGAAIALVALLIVYCLRKSAAAKRHLLWALATVSLLAVPMLSMAVPRWHVELPRWSSTNVSYRPAPQIEEKNLLEALRRDIPSYHERRGGVVITSHNDHKYNTSPLDLTRPELFTVGDSEITIPEISSSKAAITNTVGVSGERELNPAKAAVVEVMTINSTPLLLFNGFALLWIVGVFIALLRPTLGYVQLYRLKRRAQVVDEPSQRQLFEEVRAELKIKRPVRLLCDQQIQVPLTWGFWKPTVLLPAESRHWNNNRLRMVFLHELAHVKRFDWLLQTVSHLAVALHWFNPIAWHAARRLCVEQEQACDDMVISLGASACDYADELVHFSTLKPTASASALPISRESTLHQRVTRLLDGSCQRLGISGSTVLWGALCCLMLVVPLSMLTSAAQEGGTASAPGTTGAVSPSKGRHPAHVSYGGLNSFSLRTDDKVDYAFLYAGDFNSSSNFTSNTKTNTWHDDATLTTKYGKVHFTRDWTDAQQLTINGRVYPLKAGRVFSIDTVNGYPENPVQIHQVDIPIPAITKANLRTVFEAAHQPDALLTTTVGFSGAIPAGSARSLRLSSYSRHDKFRTRFAFIRAVPLSDRGADVKVIAINDSNDPDKKTWQIDTTLEIGSRTYRVQNSSESPDRLLVGDQEYDLKKGQIFVSKTDGKLLQHRVRNFPIEIRDSEDLLKIYKDFDNHAPETVTEQPQLTRHVSKEFSILAFQTEKDVAFTLYAPGFLQTGLSESKTSEGHWDHQGVVNLMDDKKQKRQFKIYHSHREPNLLYIDGEAYPLNQLVDFHGNVIKPENSTSMPFEHSGRLFVLNDERNVTPLQTGRTFQFRKKTHREEDAKLINQFAQRDLNQAQHYKFNRQLEKLENWVLAWDIYNPVQHSDGAHYARLRVFSDGRVVYADHRQGLLELKLSNVELAQLIDKLITHPAARNPKDVRTTWSNWNQETNNIRIRKDGELRILKHQSKSHEPHIYPQTGMSDEQWKEVSKILFDLLDRVNDANKQESASTTSVEPAKEKATVSEAPQLKPHVSKEFSVLAFQTEKDVAFTLYAPGLLKSELSFSEAIDGAWSYQGDVKLMKGDAVSRSFKIAYSHREPTTLYIDDKAYALVPSKNPTKLWGRLLMLTEDRGTTPLQSGRTLAYRDEKDLEAIHDIAKHDLTQARILKNYHQLQAMPGWTLTWNASFAGKIYNQWLQFPKLKIFPDGKMVYAGEQRVKGLQEFQLTEDEINTLFEKLISHPAAKQVKTPSEDFGIGPGPQLYYEELRIRKDGKEWVLQYQTNPDKPEHYSQRGMTDKQSNEISEWLNDFIEQVKDRHKQATASATEVETPKTKAPIFERPTMTRHVSKEFSVLAFQTEKDVAFTLYAPGLLKSELRYSETDDGLWSYKGDVKLLKDDAVSRSFKIAYSHREPNTLYIDDKEYLINLRDAKNQKRGRLFVLTDEQDVTPIHSSLPPFVNDVFDLKAVDRLARSDLSIGRNHVYNRQMGARPDWLLMWDVVDPNQKTRTSRFAKLRLFPDGLVFVKDRNRGVKKLQLPEDEFNRFHSELTKHVTAKVDNDSSKLGGTWKQSYHEVRMRHNQRELLVDHQEHTDNFDLNSPQQANDEHWDRIHEILVRLADRVVAANEKSNVAKTDGEPSEAKAPVSKPATTKPATTEESKASISSDKGKWGSVYGQIVFDGDLGKLDLKNVSDILKNTPEKEIHENYSKSFFEKDVVNDVNDDQSLLVNSKTGGIANVFVYLRQKPKRIDPDYTINPDAEPIDLTARNGRYTSRAMILPLGRSLRLRNESPGIANFHAHTLRNPPFNVALSQSDPPLQWKPRYVERGGTPPLLIQNDLDPASRAYCLITDHPYVAITGADGKFRIDNLPAGTHRLVIWHEALGFIDKSYAFEIDGEHNVQIPTLEVTAKGLASDPRKFWERILLLHGEMSNAQLAELQKPWHSHKRDRPFGELGFADGAKGPEWEFLRLVTHQAVQKELGLNKNQMTSLKHVRKRFEEKSNQWNEAKENPAVLQEEFEIARGVLTEDQNDRLAQIQLQRRGVQVFFDPEFQKSLNLTEKQIDAIKQAWQAHVEKSQAGWEGDEGRKSYHNVWWIALSQLDNEQRLQFDNMTGPIVGH